jgi:hypothetical protein
MDASGLACFQIAFGPYPAKAEAMSNLIIKDNAGYLIQFFGK